MKLHGLARVKNESDVIEEFVRHNLRFLDALTVVDNASFDATPKILDALRAEGLPLMVLHDPVLPKRMSETMTRVARASAAHDDWEYLFLLDADEFVNVRDRAALEGALRRLAANCHGLVAWSSYVPTARDPAREPSVLRRIRHRRATEARSISKLVLSRRRLDDAFTIGQGNHAISDARGPVAASLLDGVSLAHFPVRSLDQIQQKALFGWGAYIAMGHEEGDGAGWHQRRLFHRLETQPAWTMDDVYDIALGYIDREPASAPADTVCDPLDPVERRYGGAVPASALQGAAMYVRQLARAVAAAAREPS